ncbi:MAG: 8-oxo-dGTP diphosphatase [Clostridia bacterium]|nr:8-oxo-dGTP diphosphatase [Clostridia bacterium]
MRPKELVTLSNMCMLRDTSGRVLVLDRLDPDWPGLTFPGGHVEPRESLTDAVIREMREETGLTIVHPQLVGTKGWVNDDGSRCIVLLYTASEFTGELCSSDEGDIRWMTLSEMQSGKMADGMDIMLQVFLNEQISEHWFERNGNGWKELLK